MRIAGMYRYLAPPLRSSRGSILLLDSTSGSQTAAQENTEIRKSDMRFAKKTPPETSTTLSEPPSLPSPPPRPRPHKWRSTALLIIEYAMSFQTLLTPDLQLLEKERANMASGSCTGNCTECGSRKTSTGFPKDGVSVLGKGPKFEADVQLLCWFVSTHPRGND
jgi:hypothetical protein